jgi:hypothetical protein
MFNSTGSGRKRRSANQTLGTCAWGVVNARIAVYQNLHSSQWPLQGVHDGLAALRPR